MLEEKVHIEEDHVLYVDELILASMISKLLIHVKSSLNKKI